MAARKKISRKSASISSPLPGEPATDETPSPSATIAPAAFPIVGIAASAGGLEAFKKFFANLPADSGLGYVLVPHLDPTHESLMASLLGRHTAMPVVEAVDGRRVEVNHVYVIPPNRDMTLQGGALRLTPPAEPRGAKTSIDVFLHSLAEDQREKAIGIVLSGTGTHGTLGLKAIKANGGLAVVQDPVTAQHDQMPRSALATGLMDYVLPPEEMPEALLRYVRRPYVNGGTPDVALEGGTEQLAPILALLRLRTRFDFRCYRKKMLVRRLERRMSLKQFDDLAAYHAFLRDHPDEVQLLSKDLLISVTTFFRDPEAYQVLATQVFPELIASKDGDRPLRVWIPGCATGEEAYSLAILLTEQLAAAGKNCPLQIFASDVDEDALVVARHGVYPDTIAADVSAARLTRFFTRNDNHSYRVNKALREPIVFAAQNLITDAPFSKLDLISCRNLLIYLESEVQAKILPLLHFALNEGGSLILGPSETIGRHLDLFEPVSKKWRVYRRTGVRRPDLVEFPVNPGGGMRRVPARGTGEPTGDGQHTYADLTQQTLLAHFAPAAVLINRKHEILYIPRANQPLS